MPKYLVMPGYTLFLGRDRFMSGAVVECAPSQVADQQWKVIPLAEEPPAPSPEDRNPEALGMNREMDPKRIKKRRG